ncbi:MAG: lipopolysaccharide kinase InaA family protein [Lentisphaeria bacterium]
MKPYIVYNNYGWKGYIAEEWQDDWKNIGLWMSDNPGKIIVKYKSREVRKIKTSRGVVYLKDIYALTDAGMAGKDWLSWMKWYCRPSRARATFMVSQKMLSDGILCAEPLAGLRMRSSSGLPRDIFISREVHGEILSQKLAALEEKRKIHEIIRSVARQLELFHRKGYVHGDCLLRNLAFSSDGKLIYLDNDRTKYDRWYKLFCRKKRNLAQLGYSILRVTNRRENLNIFLEEYRKKAHWPLDIEYKNLVRSIVSRYLKRMDCGPL